MIATKEWVKSLLSKMNIGKYSTDEVRIGTWIDGKPIYSKVVNCGKAPNKTTSTTYHNIQNIDCAINCRGLVYNTSNSFSLPSVSNSGVTIHFDRNTILVQTNSDRSTYDVYAIIEYTKTTD